MSLPTDLELEVAESFKSLFPFIDKVRFLKTGSEACQAAIRFARAKTETRDIFCSGYHGWHDDFTSLTSPSAGVVGNHFIDTKEDKQKIAIIEPIELEMSEAAKTKLIGMRSKYEVLIADEIITGFRVPKYSVSSYYNVAPDIICFGKAIANGMPLSVVAGTKVIMDNPDVFVSSTFSGECLSLVACQTVIREILKRNLTALYERANLFMDNVNSVISSIGVKIEGYGTRGMLNTSDYNTAIFMQEACKAGLLFGKAYFYNFAHMEEEIEDFAMTIIHDVVSKIKKGKVRLEGKLPNSGFKRY